MRYITVTLVALALVMTASLGEAKERSMTNKWTRRR